MIIETKEIYKCEYCRRVYQVKRFAEAHEISCVKNPDNHRACFGCKHMNKRDRVLHYNTPAGEFKRTINICHCAKKEMFLYPPKVEHKENSFDLGDKLNEPMPKNCPDFVEQDYIQGCC